MRWNEILIMDEQPTEVLTKMTWLAMDNQINGQVKRHTFTTFMLHFEKWCFPSAFRCDASSFDGTIWHPGTGNRMSFLWSFDVLEKASLQLFCCLLGWTTLLFSFSIPLKKKNLLHICEINVYVGRRVASMLFILSVSAGLSVWQIVVWITAFTWKHLAAFFLFLKH